MQSIIGYGDDDHSDDGLSKPASLKPFPKPKDTLKPKPTVPVASSSTNTTPVLHLNEPRIRQPADSSSEPKLVRPGKSKSNLNVSIVRRTIAHSTKTTESPSSNEPESNSPVQTTPAEPSLQALSLGPGKMTASTNEDELAQIRTLLRPPPIPGVEDFGIPPPSDDKVDAELSAKVAKFLTLKKQGTHFNDILMRNKSFNNPHIYAKLVEFVDVDETGTNFPKNIWDPHDVQPEWYATELANAQKKRSAETTAAQAPGKRSRIAFDAASSSTSNSASTSGKHPSIIADKFRHSDKPRATSSRESGRNSGGSRHHPYPRKPTGDTNMGWMPKAHGERQGNRW